MNALLANMRWLCLPSENLGQDWFEKSRQIDSNLTSYGLDLSEEATYLYFSDTPSSILEGEGHCLVARPVIGPKRKLQGPLKLMDWKAAPAWQFPLSGGTLTELLESAEEARMKATKELKTLSSGFSLCVRRQLRPELILSVECIFHE
jgi:hypothetical protein